MQCTSPISIKNPDRFKFTKPDGSLGPEWLQVPCGHCIACRIARSREWALRLLHESESWEDTVFLTLTYDNEHCPRSLVKSDLQKFWKRLRKSIAPRKISYFACGEYGDTFGRPHYHAIVYGLSMRDREEIERTWSMGFVKVGLVTYNSCRYVAGYVQKKLYGKGAKYYEDNNLVPPYSACSKHIGEDYVERHWNQLYSQGTCTVGGVPMGLPRYYKKKLDYDSFLDYDVAREERRQNDFLSRHSSDVSSLDSLVQEGSMSLPMAREYLRAMYSEFLHASDMQKNATLEAKDKLFKRGEL